MADTGLPCTNVICMALPDAGVPVYWEVGVSLVEGSSTSAAGLLRRQSRRCSFRFLF